MPMKSKVVKIGKSYGVILPKNVAAQIGRNASAEITSSKRGVLIEIPSPATEADFYDLNTDDDIFLFTDLSHELELEK